LRPLQPRLIVPVVLALAGSLLTSLAALAQTDRRGRTSPGLVLNTSSPTGECTALAFTADGRELLAAGLDKVVHVWPVTADATPQLDERSARTLRWPAYREQRGSVYTLALSPNDGQRRIVVGGFGLKTGMLAVLDRTTGRTLRMLDDVSEPAVVWSAAFTRSGEQVVYGSDSGSLWLWDIRPGQPNRPRRLRPADRQPNAVRLIAFLDATRCLTVTRDGAVLEWDLSAAGTDKPVPQPKPRGRFEGSELFAVVLSPDGRRLAAAYEKTAFDRTVELLELDSTGPRRLLREEKGQYAQCLAFDSTGNKLAVGCRIVTPGTFFRETGGQVYLYDVRDPSARIDGPRLGYRPAAVAFHPKNARILATAGGDDHEVRLWDVEGAAKTVSELRGPGSCLWGVRFDGDDSRYIGFQERRAANPGSPNQWGSGTYRVFDLERCDQGLRRAEPFRPAPVLETDEKWTVRPTQNSALWEVVDGNGKAFPLDLRAGYDPDFNGFPRCYAFLKHRPNQPPRLAVGHNWGVSLFDLLPTGPKLVRLMIGHAGEVMSLAVSADQKTLVTASRDQTLCGWSVADWTGHPELGASFKADKNQLLIERLDPGSPTWEIGLQQGDEVTVLILGGPGRLAVYNPENRNLRERYQFVLPDGVRQLTAAETAQYVMANARPNDELFIAWRRDGREHFEPPKKVVQRPVWRLFPTRSDRGGEFIVWSYRDFYYYTNSPNADEYVGWHVNAALDAADATPSFHKLSQFERFRNREKVRELLQTFARPPERVIITQIEPPEVKFDFAGELQPGAVVKLRAAAEPRGEGEFRELESVQLWVNDYMMRTLPLTEGKLQDMDVNVPPEKLRAGLNTLTLRCFNRGGVFADKVQEVVSTTARPGKPRLFAVCIGVSDYTAYNAARVGPRCDPVASAVADAKAVGGLLGRQEGGPLFSAGVKVSVVTGNAATRAGVLKGLADLNETGPDDWLVLFLAGRGDLGVHPKFACHDGLLDLAELRKELAAFPGRKLVLMDVRPAGGGLVDGDPVKALTANLPLMAFAACRTGEMAADDGPHGLFVSALNDALGDRFADADKDGDGYLNAAELARFLRLNVPARYQDLRNRLGAAALGSESQNPIFYPDTVKLTTQPLLVRR
jgi:WD40 repeat protein